MGDRCSDFIDRKFKNHNFSYFYFHAKGGKISCDVGPVKLQGNTLLTCHFPENVQQTKRDFTIYYYRNKGNPGLHTETTVFFFFTDLCLFCISRHYFLGSLHLLVFFLKIPVKISLTKQIWIYLILC